MTKPSSGRSSLRHDALLQVLSFWLSSLPQCCNSRSRSLLQQYQCNREQSAQFTQQTNKHVRVFPFPKTLLFHPGSTISLKSPRWHTIYSVHFRAIKGSEPNKLNDEETAKECVDTVISGQEDEDDEEEEEDGDEEEDIEEEKTMEESGASYVERKDEVITVQWLVRPRIMVMITWILLDYTVQRWHWQCFDQPPILVLSLIIFHWLLMNKDSANDRCSSLICYRLVEREDIFAGDWLCWRSSTPKTFSSQIKGCRSWQWFLLGVTSKGAGLGFFWVAWFTIWWEVKFLCPWWVLDLQKLLTILYNPYILYRIIINCWWLIVDGTFESNFQIVMPGLFCPVSPHWGSAVKCYAQFRLYVEGTKHCRNFTGW